MDELDASNIATAGIGKILVDFLREQGREHPLEHGRDWINHRGNSDEEPERTTLYIVEDTSEAY